jgi:hypothetical protein
MSDDTVKKLTEALSSLTNIVGTLIEEAKVDHLNYAQKENLHRKVSETRGLLAEIQSSKLDDPTLS